MLQNGVNTKNQDDCWMNMAIKLASNGIGLTSPNPCVGAVIVHENQVIGSGFHKKAGLLPAPEGVYTRFFWCHAGTPIFYPSPGNHRPVY